MNIQQYTFAYYSVNNNKPTPPSQAKGASFPPEQKARGNFACSVYFPQDLNITEKITICIPNVHIMK